jgi:hypothetical protein
MELHKRLMNEVECRFGFTLESAEQLWNIYELTLDQPLSIDKLKTAKAF